mgnify:CR=1 FL=1
MWQQNNLKLNIWWASITYWLRKARNFSGGLLYFCRFSDTSKESIQAASAASIFVYPSVSEIIAKVSYQFLYRAGESVVLAAVNTLLVSS